MSEGEQPRSQEEFDALVREGADKMTKEINSLSEEEKKQRLEQIKVVLENNTITTDMLTPEEKIFMYVQKEAELKNR